MSSAYRAVLTVGSAACVTVGAGLLALAVTMSAQNRPLPADFGRLPVTASGASAATPAPAVTPPPTPASAASASTATTTTVGTTDRAPTARVTPAPPSAVAIPAIGVRAAVLAVHAVNGVLGVPGDPRELGWWADGAPAGAATGTVVLDGHVDSAVSGEGALFDLTRLQVGDAVLVTTTPGRTVRFVVTARRTYLKVDGLPPDLFRTDGPPGLVLITCGGPFDRSARSYLDNIVVFASPAA
ncbi:class F sortase [Pedococcus sp.]|jgi:hypothetical protein|uniref:class F sortase n=1 Tax=Pedococcus sp. TaxID=2860345 RepID=UPI002E0D5592|nr:class F sortase [Pedococcus sp.]